MILKAELITVVNESLNRDYSGIELDNKIISALKDLSQKGDFLQKELKTPTIADIDHYSLPDNLRNLFHVGLKSEDDATIYRDLKYETFKKYKLGIYGSSTTGTPTRYTWQSGFIYPRPIPDDIYNMYWFHSYVCPEIVINADEEEVPACDYILFSDIYREIIELGLLYRVALGLGLDDVQKFDALYISLLPDLRANVKKHARIVYFRDGF